MANWFSAEFQPDRLERNDEIREDQDFPKVKHFRSRIDEVEGFSEIWELVTDTVEATLGEYRRGMLLFLADLPLRLGAYHQLGTNNIVLNRRLLNIVEAATRSKKMVNAFIYSILTHEYLHALGHVSETEVRSLVYDIARECFGYDHTVTTLAENPWILLKDVPLNRMTSPEQDMELVKDLEKPNQHYIV
ncbi:MAG: hypothetical protein JSV35_04895 [Candidatus Bathyarchaeota archaeon]|nr:MAG: hypothetical protein JSV35_04895 [Candidatus Bathyarchaeota archaeon]